MVQFLKEFKNFAVKGNMIQIAVGVIIGAAFNKLIEVIVKQIFMPPITLLTQAGDNWKYKKIILREEVLSTDGAILTEEVSIGYGLFIEATIDFIIIAFVVFLVVKFMNQLTKKAENVKDKSVETPKDIELLHRVTELLEQQNEMIKKNS
jgi:large conductance mechanosensitive channel